ncbi:MAG: exodeoxyribonuclease III [Patescibacteria group bacterium]|nr:exodeoxyribonuclease III [Patescibacteria group bacterium]
MKIISWNVNGLRAVLKKDFISFLKKENPDILALQEIKISEEKINLENFNFPNYQQFWNPAKRPGYSGTLILYKNNLKILNKKNGLGLKKFDQEGRLQTIETKDFYLLNIYFPNSNDLLSRLPYKIDFNQEVLKYLKKLNKKKPVIATGDFNVAHQEIDIARPKPNEGKAGFTKEERSWMTELLQNNFIDSFRSLNPTKIQYSWWSYRAGARKKNVGWRIDYFISSKKLLKKINKAYILDQVLGSDHAPIGLELK